MGTNDEIVSHTIESAAPIPVGAGGSAQPQLTPDTVLRWIAAAGEQPWFPSQHAADTNTDRAALDAPLSQLRLAELVRVATWVRGVGQGYVLTPEGAARVANGAAPAVPAAEPPSAETPATTPETLLDEQAIRHFGLNMRPALVVPLMIFANLCWFCVGAVVAVNNGRHIGDYLSTTPPTDVLHRLGAIRGNDLLQGEWWRLLSSCFVHIGFGHLLGNLFALAILGPLAERLWGRWRLAIIYCVSGLAGSCLAMANQPDAMLAGASGAIWGVFASLFAWVMLFRTDLAEDAVVVWTRRLWLAFLLNAAVSFLPGVSWEAHLGGGVAGFVASGLLHVLRFATFWRRLLALGFLLALPVGCVGGLLGAMNASTDWGELRTRPTANAKREAAIAQQEAAILAAAAAFDKDVGPRLIQLQPAAVQGLQLRATVMLSRPKVSRKPDSVSELRTELVKLKTTADEAITLLTGPPVGFERLDTLRAKAKEFTEARSRQFGLLLAMLDSPLPPTDSELRACGEARRAADAAWEHIRPK